MTTIFLKRIYEPAKEKDGFRILVDRLWPRGLKKADSKIDLWYKETAPSTPLRKWFNHDPAKWIVFSKKYITELLKSAATTELIDHCKQHKSVTLLYGSKDEKYNHAVLLKKYIEKKLENDDAGAK